MKEVETTDLWDQLNIKVNRYIRDMGVQQVKESLELLFRAI